MTLGEFIEVAISGFCSGCFAGAMFTAVRIIRGAFRQTLTITD